MPVTGTALEWKRPIGIGQGQNTLRALDPFKSQIMRSVIAQILTRSLQDSAMKSASVPQAAVHRIGSQK